MKKSIACLRFLLTVLAWCAIPGLANAAEFPYVSCVGKEWRLFKVQSHGVGGTCLREEDVEVCRSPIASASNATSKVSITRGGTPFTDWLEEGDPSYIGQLVALASASGELVVATLQSESQGMAIRDWNVAFVHRSGIDAFAVLHVPTAEFGAEGALVKAAHSSSKGCSLLLTEWKSRNTKRGERLFLTGQLRLLTPTGFGASSAVAMQVRFDNRVKKLREQDDNRIPLSLFEARH